MRTFATVAIKRSYELICTLAISSVWAVALGGCITTPAEDRELDWQIQPQSFSYLFASADGRLCGVNALAGEAQADESNAQFPGKVACAASNIAAWDDVIVEGKAAAAFVVPSFIGKPLMQFGSTQHIWSEAGPVTRTTVVANARSVDEQNRVIVWDNNAIARVDAQGATTAVLSRTNTQREVVFAGRANDLFIVGDTGLVQIVNGVATQPLTCDDALLAGCANRITPVGVADDHTLFAMVSSPETRQLVPVAIANGTATRLPATPGPAATQEAPMCATNGAGDLACLLTFADAGFEFGPHIELIRLPRGAKHWRREGLGPVYGSLTLRYRMALRDDGAVAAAAQIPDGPTYLLAPHR